MPSVVWNCVHARDYAMESRSSNGFPRFLYVQFGYAAFASAIAERFDTAENT